MDRGRWLADGVLGEVVGKVGQEFFCEGDLIVGSWKTGFHFARGLVAVTARIMKFWGV